MKNLKRRQLLIFSFFIVIFLFFFFLFHYFRTQIQNNSLISGEDKAVSSPQATPSNGLSPTALANVFSGNQKKNNLDIGAWVWKSPLEISDDTWREWLSFCKEEGIQSLYLDIGSVADIEELHDSSQRKEKEDAFTKRLQILVAQAAKEGVKVQGLAGNNTWADPAYYYIPEKIVGFVASYNQASPPESRLAGMQFDIEPYQQPAFENAGSRPKILQNFFRLLERLTDLMKNNAPDVQFGIAVPYWLDGESDRAQPLSWNGHSQVPVFHVMDIMARFSHAYMVILDYRDTADGKNGSIEHASGELAYARAHTSNLRVLIGQETSYTKPASISFHGHPKADFKKALVALVRAFSDNPSFGGFAIHHLESYIQMRE